MLDLEERRQDAEVTPPDGRLLALLNQAVTYQVHARMRMCIRMYICIRRLLALLNQAVTYQVSGTTNVSLLTP